MDNQIERKLYKFMKKRETSVDFLQKKGLAMLKQDIQMMSDIQEGEFESQTVSDTYKQMTEELKNYGYEEFRFQGSDSSGYLLLAKKKESNIRHAIKGILSKHNNEESKEEQSDCDNQIKMLRECSGSPYTLNILDVKEGEQMSYLILNENKGTLEQLLEEQGGKLSELSVIKYAKDIAEGIYHIHKKGYFIQDLNLGRILIDCNNNAVVNNFGLGDQKVMKENSLYCAPEIEQNYQEKYAKDNIEVTSSPSKRSDAFSFGYLIYSLLFGETELQRYEEKKDTSLDFANLNDSSSYKESLQNIISGLTKFNPNQRMSIQDSFLMLKGIVSLELDLEQQYNNPFTGSYEDLFSKYQNEVQIIQLTQTSFFPIIDKNAICSSSLQHQSDSSLLNENKQNRNIENLNSGNQTIENLLEQIVIVQREIGNFGKQIGNFGEDISKNKELQNQIKNLELQIKSKDEEILDLTNQLSKEKQDSENQKKENEIKNNNLIEQIASKDKEMDDLKKQIDQLNISIQNQFEQLQNMGNLKKQLQNEKQINENLRIELQEQNNSEPDEYNSSQFHHIPGWYCDKCGNYKGQIYGYFYGCQKQFSCSKCNRNTTHTLER